MLYMGTSGFSYDDWVGNFYPEGLKKQDWLRYYAAEFNALELNSTYYAIPRLSTVRSILDKTGEGFLFAVKANQEMTHQQTRETGVFRAFLQMLQPFVNAGKLGCVLAQFPYSFHFNSANRGYIEYFKEKMGSVPVVIEFRNADWLKPDTFKWLRGNNLGFCCVDEPALPKLVPPVAEVTGDVAYVRFHGRNAAKWWQHDHAYERYDYEYSAEELQEWLPRIHRLDSQAANTFVFANNHWQSKSVNTIRQLRLMLD
jgi:uncharacterized protein YecE (DUF72 family)